MGWGPEGSRGGGRVDPSGMPWDDDASGGGSKGEYGWLLWAIGVVVAFSAYIVGLDWAAENNISVLFLLLAVPFGVLVVLLHVTEPNTRVYRNPAAWVLTTVGLALCLVGITLTGVFG